MSLEQGAIAANRFGLGARPGEIRQISSDPRGWLLAQLTPEQSLPAPIAALPATKDAADAFGLWLQTLGIGAGARARGNLFQRGQMAEPITAQSGAAQPGAAQSGAAQPGAGQAMGGGGQQKLSVEQSYVRAFGPGYAAAVQARFRVATTTDRPFFERLARFWSNHFTVSAAKPEVIALAPAYERDVVRPNVCGAFETMLRASTQHPGMLFYLDNWSSIGPHSPLAQNPQVLPVYLRERMKGLNENLAREILELHTLGVRSGYTQADVTSLAKIITGWSIYGRAQRPSDNALFHFIDYAHEPGAQVLLGKTYGDNGLAQGTTALRDLARHPATAQHIATKLARHFIADDPPAPAVERLAKAWRDTDGDLHAVSVALVQSPEAWTAHNAKMKPPEDYVISAVRALGGPSLTGLQIVALLDRMGQRPYWAPGPDGWSDIEANWIGADAIWKRIEWANALAVGYAAATIDPAGVADNALGPNLGAETLQAIRLAESPAQGLALLLVSPEFQRR